MKFVVRPELPTASAGSSQAPTAAVDNSAPSATRPQSTYKSGKAVQTNGATSLRTDAAMLVRILENLVSNAIKFTRGRVLMAARRDGGAVHVEVWDQGPGIPLDCVDKVFDAFYQGHPVREDTMEGVGLGLAIVKRLADALGYRIDVVSSPGRGTLMRLIIPAKDVV